MKKLFYIIGLCFLFLLLQTSTSLAQEPGIPIAILPFTANNANAKTITNLVQETVARSFVSKKRFFLIDRSKTDKLKKEIELSKTKDFINSATFIESGRQAGAAFIITGTVDPLEISLNTSKDMLSGDMKKPLEKKETVDRYIGSLALILQISRVEDGKVILSKPILVKSAEFDIKNETKIRENIICHLENTMQSELRSLFPPLMMIVGIETKSKKDLPEKVLINAGNDMFDDSKNNSPCPGDAEISTASATSAVASVFNKITGGKKIALEIYTIEKVNVAGKTMNREKTIGELKLDKIEDDNFSICSVVSGEKEIKTFLDSKQTLYVKMKTS